MRIDADMMTKKNLFREVLDDFRRGKNHALVGTQMIAKGLDFPNVLLVGVVDADLPLRMEDFGASERVFQLLVQVGGRAGRGDRAGEVYVQTYALARTLDSIFAQSRSEWFLRRRIGTEKRIRIPAVPASNPPPF